MIEDLAVDALDALVHDTIPCSYTVGSRWGVGGGRGNDFRHHRQSRSEAHTFTIRAFLVSVFADRLDCRVSVRRVTPSQQRRPSNEKLLWPRKSGAAHSGLVQNDFFHSSLSWLGLLPLRYGICSDKQQALGRSTTEIVPYCLRHGRTAGHVCWRFPSILVCPNVCFYSGVVVLCRVNLSRSDADASGKAVGCVTSPGNGFWIPIVMFSISFYSH